MIPLTKPFLQFCEGYVVGCPRFFFVFLPRIAVLSNVCYPDFSELLSHASHLLFLFLLLFEFKSRRQLLKK
jgi:hypothetical protein